MDKKLLSTLIREGALLRPKCRGTFFEKGCSCAIGAALEAAGVAYNESHRQIGEIAAPMFPELFRSPTSFTDLGSEIYRSNDQVSNEMTREEIADLLEGRGL